MRLVEFQLDPNCNDSDIFFADIAINPTQIAIVEPDFVSTPKTEYECTKITLINGKTYWVTDEFKQAIEKINA